MKRLPFDGEITRHLHETLPKRLRRRIDEASKHDILSDSYPYPQRMEKDAYRDERDALQIELVKLQSWVRDTGARVVVVFEGRDAAGKGGSIKRMAENLSPRVARVVALPKPSDTEQGQWYFQRYIAELPTEGEIVLFDRSWYNRAVVERVFGFSDDAARTLFFAQAPDFERMLVGEGIRLFKLWLTVSRAEQMRRMLKREADPLKQWKLSRIDIDGLARWDDYTRAILEMFARTHTPECPWTVVRADDKRRARLATQRAVLSAIDYAGRDPAVAAPPDPRITGGPELMPPGDG